MAEAALNMCGKMAAQKQFLLGILVGLTVAFVFSGYRLLSSENIVRRDPLVESINNPRFGARLADHLANNEIDSLLEHGDDHEAFDKAMEKRGPGVMLDIHDEHAHHDDDSEARRLFKEVRVLVWVMTAPQNLQSKARVVRDTWGKRCNKLLFFSSETDKSFPAIGLNVSEGREHLTAKTMQGFRYVYEHHLDDADWFMKVDDDTYLIVENLRYFLSNEDTSEPVWFGHHFKTIVKQGYYSGGGGYVLSKEALKRFYEKGTDTNLCRQDGGAEDAELGRCMENLGVRTANTTDVLGRSRFHCFDPETFLFGGYPGWYYQYDTNGARKGIGTMSDYSITFHYVSPEKMQALEFYIYHLNPYGVINGRQSLNRATFRSQKAPPTR